MLMRLLFSRFNLLMNENEEFVSIEDEELLNKVFELFKAQYDGYMKFE